MRGIAGALLVLAGCQTTSQQVTNEEIFQTFDISETQGGVVVSLYGKGASEPFQRIQLKNCNAGENYICWEAEDIRIVFPASCRAPYYGNELLEKGFLTSLIPHSSQFVVFSHPVPMRLAYGYWDRSGLTQLILQDAPSKAETFLGYPVEKTFFARSKLKGRFACSNEARG